MIPTPQYQKSLKSIIWKIKPLIKTQNSSRVWLDEGKACVIVVKFLNLLRFWLSDDGQDQILKRSSTIIIPSRWIYNWCACATTTENFFILKIIMLITTIAFEAICLIIALQILCICFNSIKKIKLEFCSISLKIKPQNVFFKFVEQTINPILMKFSRKILLLLLLFIRDFCTHLNVINIARARAVFSDQ